MRLYLLILKGTEADIVHTTRMVFAKECAAQRPGASINRRGGGKKQIKVNRPFTCCFVFFTHSFRLPRPSLKREREVLEVVAWKLERGI
jgi:hypothetical protein